MNQEMPSPLLQIDLRRYPSRLSLRNKLARICWTLVWALLFRPSPRILYAWRHFLLRCFGAKIGPRCAVYPSCKIWAPWNLEMEEQSALSDAVDCYCVDKVRIGAHATISQYTFLCTASHDISSAHMRLITEPITMNTAGTIT
jgi:putative colanic acid biosynthesis acetyltransferase WcaF